MTGSNSKRSLRQKGQLSMIDILIGCPSRNRAWILPEWRRHIESSLFDEDVSLHYTFVIGDDDLETKRLIETWDYTSHITVTEPDYGPKRRWNASRYSHMVTLRNQLLDIVRFIDPDYFFSIDSDILVHPESMNSMIKTLHNLDVDAVGGVTYLDPVDIRCTNLGNWQDYSTKTGFKRVENPGTHMVDIIMAYKLMSRNAYNIDYEYHKAGEDLGWSKACNNQGVRLACDGTYPSKHIMTPDALDRVDKRVGY